jgi:DNA-binding transcriptional LysR family regulator
MIQLHRLEGFYWVARTRGYAAAARAFPYPITQPAVYQQVRKLEEELRTPLFERVARDRVEPTAAGAQLYAFCAPFFEELPGIARSIETGSFGGVLRIEAAPLEIRHVLPKLIKRLRTARPEVEIQLAEVQTPDPARLLGAHIDLMIDHLPHVPDGVSRIEIGQHRAFLAVPAGWRKPSARSAASLLRDAPFVSYAPSLVQYDLQMRGLRELGVAAQRKLSASSTEALLGFVASGLGFSLVPWPDAAGPKLRGVVCVALAGRAWRFPIHAAYRTRAGKDPLLQAALGAFGR